MGLPSRFHANHLHVIAHRLFMAAGTPHPIADFVAHILVNANLAGHDSHGVQFLPMYLDRIENGRNHSRRRTRYRQRNRDNATR